MLSNVQSRWKPLRDSLLDSYSLLWQIHNATWLERWAVPSYRVTSGSPGVDSVLQPEGAIS